MDMDDIEEEIEKLKARKIELTNRMNMITSFDDKEDLRQDINRITSQIELLEKLKK
jgi:hypothetical protein